MREEKKTEVVDALGLFPDVFLGDVLVSVIGRRVVRVENYRSLILYTDTLVKIQAKTTKLLIRGRGLLVERYCEDEMMVCGAIQSLEFED